MNHESRINQSSNQPIKVAIGIRLSRAEVIAQPKVNLKGGSYGFRSGHIEKRVISRT
jgi:hypothetical protein